MGVSIVSANELWHGGDHEGAYLVAKARCAQLRGGQLVQQYLACCRLMQNYEREQQAATAARIRQQLEINGTKTPYEGESGAIRQHAAVILRNHPGTSFDSLVDGIVAEMRGDPWTAEHRKKICSALGTGIKLQEFRRDDLDRWYLAA